ncbi:MAG: DEAD/DEAH box helicase [Thiovulaceae bacterium]|nr:DEAD/DEAH box helicase [Sulfurimonadaceae bacterium]
MTQSRLFEQFRKQNINDLELLICEDEKESHHLADVAKFFERDVLLFPDFRARFEDDLRPFKEEMQELFKALRYYYTAKEKPLVISPFKTLLFPLPKPELLETTSIEYAQTLDLKAFKEKMLFWGYSFVDMVQVEGEISFRGDIIDIFTPNSENPYRISLFDEEIEEIKHFTLEKQRTVGELIDAIEIAPALYSLNEKGFESIRQQCEESVSDSFVKDTASLGFWYLDSRASSFLDDKKALFIKPMEGLLDEVYIINDPQVPRESFGFDVMPEEQHYKELAVTNVSTLISVHKNKKVTIIASNDAQIKQANIFDTTGIEIRYSPIILNVIGDREIVISLNKPVAKRRRRKSSIILDDLKRGDYVVHEEYGVGIFVGIEQAEILGGVKDFVTIKYQGDDKVLLPVENLEMIDRYMAGSGALPVLDKLGKGSFGRLKEKVKKRLFEIASEIINTAASRALIKAPVIAYEKEEIKSFQEMAGFDYTQDQSQSIQEILTEMASGHIMDRLLSGDVGFGKTEVAMNAIFAVAKAGFQSALIVPTTLLSSQHFVSLEERFERLGIKIAKLDRFITPRAQKAVLAGLKEGRIDAVVGTHALFGAEFKKLGLVIIDEEHKFGVKQKEKLKQLYEEVHLLSMSATPIPRSLNQALSSIKTMSQLLTPPSERQGVRTFVKAYDEKLVKEVILRERRRGGQVFYVFNNIKMMPIKKGELQKLLPDLRILMLHSQISAVETEKALLDFQNGKYDLMLATSIIESGIHMPQVNTMLIEGADRFGIADLHQLRGRVGRGHVEGFAYCIVDNKENLTDEAKKRLVALESNSFLGSGSILAFHDLEIRGGGNLVGDAQSGHIKNIGYSLYLRMLEDAIKELSNTKEKARAKVDIKLAISAYISDEVVQEDRLRLELYRRLSQCEEPTEIYEIEEEAIDRFGKLDEPTKQFFEMMVIKLLSIERKIVKVMNYGQKITVEYANGSKESLKAASKDDDDIIKAVLHYLRTAKPKVL